MALSSTATCVVAGTSGQAIVQVTLTAPNGAQYNNEDVQFAVQGAGANAAGRIGNMYYQVVSAPLAQGELRVSASVGCDDGTRLALGPEQVISVVANDALGESGRTGGCAEVAGHVWVRVINDEGQPIPNSWVQIGNADQPDFQDDAANAMRGVAGEALACNEQMLKVSRSLSILETCSAHTVTAGAAGYERLGHFLSKCAVTWHFGRRRHRPFQTDPLVVKWLISTTLDGMDRRIWAW